jgi:nucleoside-diphosphate-sugar epimerase
MGNGRQKWQSIAIDDLIYYLLGALNAPRTYGQCYDVGSDDSITTNQMIDITADVLGRSHPLKIPVPQQLLAVFAPLIERAGKLPLGSIKAFVDGLTTNLIGDPMPIRGILPRPPLPYRQAVERALQRNA